MNLAIRANENVRDITFPCGNRVVVNADNGHVTASRGKTFLALPGDKADTVIPGYENHKCPTSNLLSISKALSLPLQRGRSNAPVDFGPAANAEHPPTARELAEIAHDGEPKPGVV